MKKLILIVSTAFSFVSCANGPLREERDGRLYDKTYLIFIKDVVNSDGSETIAHQLYKIDGSREKFASGRSGITAAAVTFRYENEDDRDSVIKDFSIQYPDSRIYVNDKLWEE
jgi:hypothetical protein